MMKRSWFHRHGQVSGATQSATASGICDAERVALVHTNHAFGSKIDIEIDGHCRGGREPLCQYESGKEGLPMMKTTKRAAAALAANKLTVRKETIRVLRTRELLAAVGGEKPVATGITESCVSCPTV